MIYFNSWYLKKGRKKIVDDWTLLHSLQNARHKIRSHRNQRIIVFSWHLLHVENGLWKQKVFYLKEYFETLSEARPFKISKECKPWHSFRSREIGIGRSLFVVPVFFFNSKERSGQIQAIDKIFHDPRKKKLENRRWTSGFSKCFQKEGFGKELAKLTKYLSNIFLSVDFLVL